MSNYRITIPGMYAEKVTLPLTFPLVDENQAPVPSAQITTLTIHLYVRGTMALVNPARLAGSSILNVNNGSMDPTSGVVTLILQPLDTVVVDQTRRHEKHVARAEWTWAGGAKTWRTELVHTIKNMAGVT